MAMSPIRGGAGTPQEAKTATLKGKLAAHTVVHLQGASAISQVPKQEIYSESRALNFQAKVLDDVWKAQHPLAASEIEKTSDIIQG